MTECSFNDIGNFLSTNSEMGANAQYRVDLDPNNVLVRESIFKKDGDAFVFDNEGLEKFLYRRFGCKEFTHAGNVCCLGTVSGKMLHYSVAPSPNFYNMHGDESSVIIGSNAANIPSAWKGHPALLSYCLTIRNDAINVRKDGMQMLFPANGEPKKPSGSKKPNARLRSWLEYLCEHITILQEKYGVLMSKPSYTTRRQYRGKYNPRDFVRPKPKDVLKWMTENTAVTITTDQTFRRDIKGFLEFDPKKYKTQVYDKRNRLIAQIWKLIDDPKFLLNPKTLAAITDEMARIDATEVGHLAEYAATAKTAYEDDADSTGHNPTRTVVVAPNIDVDKPLWSFAKVNET